MKQNAKITSLICAAAISLGAVLPAAAQSANVAVPNPGDTATTGLIGSRYTSATYNYSDLTGPGPKDANGFAIAFNSPVNSFLDLTANYDWARANYAGMRFTQQDLSLGATVYSRLEWGKPFAMADAGWQWGKGGGVSDDSFVYKVGVGAEFQVAPALAVTPYVNFVRATGFNDSEFDFGVKAAYRVTRDWSIIAKAQYDAIRHDKDAAEYSIGAAYHF